MKPSNISSAFKKCRKENRPALLTYTVSGDPNKKKSFEILKAISSYADICEIGVGHNCNTGDGKQIQDSTYRAIKNGIKIKDTFAIVKNLRKPKMQNLVFLWVTIIRLFNMVKIDLLKNANRLELTD